MTEDSRQTIVHEQPLSVEVSRSTKGVYSWTMKFRATGTDEVRKVLMDMDTILRRDYVDGGVGPEEGLL